MIEDFRLAIGLTPEIDKEKSRAALFGLAQSYASIMLELSPHFIAETEPEYATMHITVVWMLEDGRRKQKSFYLTDWVTGKTF